MIIGIKGFEGNIKPIGVDFYQRPPFYPVSDKGGASSRVLSSTR